jgi:hypothetical protein
MRNHKTSGKLCRSNFSQPATLRDSGNPQKAHSQERQKIQQQVPSSKAGGRWHHLRHSFAAASRTRQNEAHFPIFLLVKLNFSFVFHLAAQIHVPCGVHNLGQPATRRLHSNLNLQVFRDRSTWYGIHHDEKRADAKIRVSPQRNDVRPDMLIGDDWERRTIVRRRTRRTEHREQARPKTSKHYLRHSAITLTLHRYLHARHHPPIIVARISIG